MHRLLAKIQQERALAQINAGHMRQRYSAPKRPACLRMFSISSRPHDAFGKPGKIFHQRGERELAAGLVALNHQRLQIGASCVERGSMTGAAGTNDDDVANVSIMICGSATVLDCRIQIWMQVLVAPALRLRSGQARRLTKPLPRRLLLLRRSLPGGLFAAASSTPRGPAPVHPVRCVRAPSKPR